MPITADYQVSIAPLGNDAQEFVLGSGTPYLIDKFLGLNVDDFRTDDVPRSQEHGAWPGGDLLNARELTLEVVTFGSTGDPALGGRSQALVWANQDALVGAWVGRSLTMSDAAPSVANMVLRYKLPGQPIRRFLGRARKVNRSDSTAIFGYAGIALQFMALDPRSYDDVPLNGNVTIGQPTRTNLATDPSMETVSGTTVVRTNLMPNPTVQVDLVSWTSYSGATGAATLSRQTAQTGWAAAISASARTTWTTAGTTVDGGLLADTATGALTVGRNYAAAAQVRSSKVQRVMAYLQWIDSAGAGISNSASGTQVVLAANTAATVEVNNVLAPTGASRARLVVVSAAGTSGTVWAVGDWIEVTGVHIEETRQTLNASGGGGAMGGAFTGSYGAGSYGADYTYTWVGTSNASASQQRAPGLAQYSPAGTGLTVARSTEGDAQHAGSMKIGWGYAIGYGQQGDGQFVVGFVVGQTYTYSRDVYVPSGSPAVAIRVDSIADSAVSTANNSWQRLTMTFVATATGHTLRVVNTANIQRGDYCYTDLMLIEAGASAGSYFDGSTTAAPPYLFAWTGAANASTSERRYTGSGGALFPATFPLTFGASTEGILTVNNAGNFVAQPTFTITGPIANPRVDNLTDGTFIQVNITLGPTDVLTIDGDADRILLGGASRLAALATGSRFPTLRPGMSTLRLSGVVATGDVPAFAVAFRSAWL